MKISLSSVTSENRSSIPESVILVSPFGNHYYKIFILQYTPLENQEKIEFGGVLELIFSPIYILKSIVKLRKRDNSNKGIKSESMDSPVTAPDVDNKAGDNGNGKNEDVLIETTSNDTVIPMGENRIPEHDEGFRDF